MGYQFVRTAFANFFYYSRDFNTYNLASSRGRGVHAFPLEDIHSVERKRFHLISRSHGFVSFT